MKIRRKKSIYKAKRIILKKTIISFILCRRGFKYAECNPYKEGKIP